MAFLNEFTMPSLVISIFLGAIGVYGLLWSALHATQHSKEPPLVEDAIPFLGPIISMITQKTNFYVNLRSVPPHSTPYVLPTSN